MSYHFVCNHCGKKFELETPEAKECPFCFWSSSVKREDELLAGKEGVSHSSQNGVSGSGRKASPENLNYPFQALLFMAILAAFGFLAYKAYKIFTASSSPGWKTFSIKPPADSKKSEKPAADPVT
ncbi:MAG: hypothetical protein HY767_03825, partial [Candidatus Omnitrophica bacterium]|nr:hypothetical protein [Candidatus Omnitrophota bacterium]